MSDAAARPQPLSYLFGSESPSTADVLKERLHTDEKIRHMVSAQIVTLDKNFPGELLIGETSLYFVPNSEPSKLDNNEPPKHDSNEPSKHDVSLNFKH